MKIKLLMSIFIFYFILLANLNGILAEHYIVQVKQNLPGQNNSPMLITDSALVQITNESLASIELKIDQAPEL